MSLYISLLCAEERFSADIGMITVQSRRGLSSMRISPAPLGNLAITHIRGRPILHIDAFRKSDIIIDLNLIVLIQHLNLFCDFLKVESANRDILLALHESLADFLILILF